MGARVDPFFPPWQALVRMHVCVCVGCHYYKDRIHFVLFISIVPLDATLIPIVCGFPAGPEGTGKNLSDINPIPRQDKVMSGIKPFGHLARLPY